MNSVLFINFLIKLGLKLLLLGTGDDDDASHGTSGRPLPQRLARISSVARRARRWKSKERCFLQKRRSRP